MDQKPQRKTELKICLLPIFLGVFCMLGTIALAFNLKDKIKEGFREPPQVQDFEEPLKMKELNFKIDSKARAIKFEKELFDFEAPQDESGGKLNKTSNKKKDAPGVFGSRQNRAEKIELMENEYARLLAEREALKAEIREKQAPRRRTWGDFFEDWNIEFLLKAVLPLAVLVLMLGQIAFVGKLPARNPLSLTDFEKRCVLFLAFSMVASPFGFALFCWFLSISA